MNPALTTALCALLVDCGPAPAVVAVAPQPNSYPRVLDATAVPERTSNLSLGGNCKHPQFSALVEDPDLADRIRARWFVDPDVAFSTVFFVSSTLEVSEKPVRNTPISAPATMFSAGSKLAEAGQHRLTLVIADGEFETGITTSPRTLPLTDGGATLDPSYTHSFSWSVTTDLSPCP